MKKNYDSVAFCKSDYDNEKNFWEDISTMMKILSRNKYEMAFRHEDIDVYILEWNYNRYCSFGNPIVRWENEDDA